MAIISYTGVADGDTRSAPQVNSIFNAFVTQSTALTGPNFRNEGLDERVMAAGTATDGFCYVEATDRPGPAFTNVAWAQLIPQTGGVNVPIELSNGGAGWQVGQNVGTVRVRFATSWSYDWAYAGTTPTLSLELRFRITYQIDGGGVWTYVPKSQRNFAAYNAVATSALTNAWVPSPPAPPPPVQPFVFPPKYYDNFKYAFLLPYPLDGATHTIDKVRMEIQISNNTHPYLIGATTFTAMRFVRSVT